MDSSSKSADQRRCGTGNDYLQNVLLSYAVGNLAMAPFWYLFFGRNNMGLDETFVAHFYELPQEFSGPDCIAAVILGGLISCVVYFVLRVCRNYSFSVYRLAEAIVIIPTFSFLTILVCYLILRNYYLESNTFAVLAADNLVRGVQIAVPAVGVALVMSVAVLRFKKAVMPVCRFVVLCTAPIGVVFTANAVAAYTKILPSDGSFYAVDYSLAPAQNLSTPRPTILFIVFDEWDQRLTFEDRRPGLDLPEIDRLTAQAFVATNVERPGAYTFVAMPSLLSGRKVKTAKSIPGDDLEIVWSDTGENVSWRNQSVFFDDARKFGFNTAVVATAIHPYCRMFRRAISDCWVDDTPFDYEYNSVINRIDDLVLRSISHIPFVKELIDGPTKRLHSQPSVNVVFNMRDTIERKVLDARWTFVFMHVRLPHDPYIYDLRRGEYGIVDSDDATAYWGNLVALDKFIGHLRATFEEADIWDDLTVLLTADHGYKGVETHYRHDPKNRVPLIVKFPGQRKGVVFEQQASAVKIRSALHAIFAGKIDVPDALGSYLVVDKLKR